MLGTYSPGSPFYGGQGAGGGPGGLPGAPSFGYSGAYGGVPQVPDPTQTAAAAAAGGQANLPALSGLSGGVNQFNTNQQLQQLQAMIPGYTDASAKSSQNILAELSGQVPSDVINQIIQSSAERGVLTGGGPNANAAYLRALGLTSIGQQNAGEQHLAGAIARTPRPQLFRPDQYFTTPQQQQEAQLYANIYGSAPNPQQAALEAMRQSQRGFNTGAGSVPRAPGVTMGTGAAPSWNTPGNLNTAQGMNYSGGGPDTAANWNAWASGIRGGGETEEDAWRSIGVNPFVNSPYPTSPVGSQPGEGGGLFGSGYGGGIPTLDQSGNLPTLPPGYPGDVASGGSNIPNFSNQINDLYGDLFPNP